ncbi:hypothetical protein C8J57DRAFT_1722162 [Mycena rebaudengoi]|nr:hypothetical protein C8J57DRAFT_1722162 [Mycena rebaudengoi]
MPQDARAEQEQSGERGGHSLRVRNALISEPEREHGEGGGGGERKKIKEAESALPNSTTVTSLIDNNSGEHVWLAVETTVSTVSTLFAVEGRSCGLRPPRLNSHSASLTCSRRSAACSGTPGTILLLSTDTSPIYPQDVSKPQPPVRPPLLIHGRLPIPHVSCCCALIVHHLCAPRSLNRSRTSLMLPYTPRAEYVPTCPQDMSLICPNPNPRPPVLSASFIHPSSCLPRLCSSAAHDLHQLFTDARLSGLILILL